jgi:pimeloyl-ACP methyl ester carboxylesterase
MLRLRGIVTVQGETMVRKFGRILGVLAIALIAIGGVVYLFFPAMLVDFSRQQERNAAGLTEHSVTVADHRIPYLAGGQGETILLLHGFSADKDNWTRFAKYLTANYHVIAPDLPGFGDSDRLDDALYDVRSQVDRIAAFVSALGLTSFHLAGNSMGGHISVAYAHTHPRQVKTLGLFPSGGVTAPSPSEFRRALANGRNLLLVDNVADFDRMLAFVFVEKPSVPRPVMRYLAESSVKSRAFNDRIAGHLSASPFALEPILSDIQQPTLLVWGEKDRVIDVSAASVFAEAIPNAELKIIPNVGHLPIIERPEETASYYTDFLERYRVESLRGRTPEF